MIKKILWALIVLAVIAAIGAAGVFFALKSLDRATLKPKIVAAAEKATGLRIRLDDLDFSWRGGPAVELRGLSVYGEGDATEPAVTVKKTFLSVDLGALIRREIRIPDLLLDTASVHLIRGENGELNLRTKGGNGGAAFGLGRVMLKDSSIKFTDLAKGQAQAAEISVSMLDADLRSEGTGMRFALKAAVLGSPARNLELSGRAPSLDLSRLEAKLKLVLDPIDFDLLKQKMPGLKLPFAGFPFRGSISGDLKGMTLADGRLAAVQGEWRADLKEFRTGVSKGPLRDVHAVLALQGNRAVLEQGEAKWGGGTLAVSGAADDIFGTPSVNLKAGVRGVDIHEAMPERPGSSWTVRGPLSGDVELAFRGLSKPEVYSSLTGDGQVELVGGVVENKNILRSLLKKISEIPLIGTDIAALLSPNYRQLAARKDMDLRIAQARFSIGGGNVTLYETTLAADEFLVQGAGHISFAGRLKLNSWLFVSQGLSAEAIHYVPDLAVFTDPQTNQLAFPFAIGGELGSPRIVVNKDFLVGRIVASRGGRLLGDVLGGGSSQGQAAGSAPASGTAGKSIF